MAASFEPFADEFLQRTGQIIWCTATTVDARCRPRSRMLHPIWEVSDGLPVGWVVTSQTPVKTAHLARNPHLACMYWNPDQNTVSIDCLARWATDAEKPHVWNLFMTTPPPLGYDLSGFGAERWDNPLFNPLRLDPWRVQFLLGEHFKGFPSDFCQLSGITKKPATSAFSGYNRTYVLLPIDDYWQRFVATAATYWPHQEPCYEHHPAHRR